MPRSIPIWRQRPWQIAGAAVAVVALSVGVAVAFLGGDETDEATPPTSAPTTTTTVPPTTTTVVGVVAPLTGLADPSGLTRSREALSIKIGNDVVARPQAGLDLADVVYDEVVEGGITRFVAVFHSATPERAGPVRSVRRTDAAIVTPLGGVFAFSGGAQYALESIAAAPVVRVDENNAGDDLVRDPERRRPHNLFAIPERLWEREGTPVPPPPLFSYLAPGEAFSGEPARGFAVQLKEPFAPNYRWDAGGGVWRRFQGGEPHTAEGDAQISPTNVVVQFTEYQGGVGVLGAEGVLVGRGEAWIFAAGQVIKGQWVRDAVDQPTRYIDAAGQPVQLLPGRTWVELAPVGTGVPILP